MITEPLQWIFAVLLGRWLLVRIDQQLFEKLVLALSAIAGILLIV